MFRGPWQHTNGLILSGGLRLIKCVISQAKYRRVRNRARRVGGPGKRCPPYRAGSKNSLSASEFERLVRYRCQHACRKSVSFVAIGVARDDQKFFATPPNQDVRKPDSGRNAS